MGGRAGQADGDGLTMAGTYTLFPVKVVTPEGVCYEGDARELEVTSVSGGMGILARRAPVVADLKMGRVRVQLEDGTWRTWATERGFVQASSSTATVVVDAALDAADIDPASVAELIDTAKTRLESAQAAGDDAETQIARREIAWGEHLSTVAAP